MLRTADDIEKVFDGLKKAAEAMKNEMPELKPGYLIRLDGKDRLSMITEVSDDKTIDILYLHNSDRKKRVAFKEITTIYKYNTHKTGVDLAGNEKEKSLIYEKMWERSKSTEINKNRDEFSLMVTGFSGKEELVIALLDKEVSIEIKPKQCIGGAKWECSKPKEISKDLAESILREKLGKDIRIAGE